MSDHDEIEEPYIHKRTLYLCQCGHEEERDTPYTTCECGNTVCVECARTCQQCDHEGCESCMWDDPDGDGAFCGPECHQAWQAGWHRSMRRFDALIARRQAEAAGKGA